MLAFDSLVRSSTRVNAQRVMEQAVVNMVSAQGDDKAMKALLKPYKKQLFVGKKKRNDQQAFLNQFGKGL